MVAPQKILIIKLGAIGDVLRTTPILHGLKRKYPHSFITWLTLKESRELLRNNPLIGRLFIYGRQARQKLKRETFDILVCLDKEKEAITLASALKAKTKIGFGRDEKTGRLIPLNKESFYAFRLGICDELKFRKNKKTYPEIIFEMAGLKYRKEGYMLDVPANDKAYARRLFSKIGIKNKEPVIGLNTGAGSRFANKAWTRGGFIELIRLMRRHTRAIPLLLGGPRELKRNAWIFSRSGGLAYDAGCNHSLGKFAAIIDLCSLVVTSDTTAMHIAIALKKKVVALFGSTCAQEIELYGRGMKIFSALSCRPCYKKECKKKINCMNSIKPQRVFQAVLKLL
ncbi:MAG: glycosyltransferase family 9 protein [Candidatus Omnitrophica bacterium]|nr:glycosyltransferase family 9 protein [Candidatus Omnitrophota bacterium]